MEDHPEGYPQVAAYQNSDSSSALFRRFGNLHARSLLYKEVELTDLEAKLAELDREDNSKDDTEWRIAHSIHHDDGKNNEARKALMSEIYQKLEVYGASTVLNVECH